MRSYRNAFVFALAGNVVLVGNLEDAVTHVNVATQTIGIYPDERKTQLRDKLAAAGAQRLCRVGTAYEHVGGSPHDAMFPLQRLVHWMADDQIDHHGAD